MPKQITAPQIIVELAEDPEISEFLSYQKKSTQHTYTSYFRRLKEFCDATGKEMLADPELWRKKIFGFKKWLQNQGYSEYYIQSATGAVRGFFAHNGTELKFNRADRKRLRERIRKTEDYPLDKEDISKMAMVGNLKERYVLLVGKSLGLRASDFVNLTYGKFRGLKLENGAPMFLGETVTLKERVKAFPYLDTDAVPIIKAILDANKDKPNSMYILMTRSKKKHNTWNRMQPAELSYILQSLARKANIEHGSKRIRFHCLRKFLCDRLSSIMSESKWKHIVGKKISEDAYINSESLKEDYSKVMEKTCIEVRTDNERIAQLEKKVIEQQKQLLSLKEESDKRDASMNMKNFLLQFDLDTLTRRLGKKTIYKILKEQDKYEEGQE
jgi:site-specific recombinase XerD